MARTSKLPETHTLVLNAANPWSRASSAERQIEETRGLIAARSTILAA